MSTSQPMAYLNVLSPEQVRQIHETALRILEEVGLWLPNDDVVEHLHAAGAQIADSGSLVRLPAALVEQKILEFPPGFTWHARDPKNALEIDGSRTHFSFPDSAINIIDLEGRHRQGTPADGEDICRFCDALPEMGIASTGLGPAVLRAGELAAWHTKTMFTHSSKPVFGICRSTEISRMVLRMAEAVADCCDLPEGELPIAIITNPISPLLNTPDVLAGMLEYLHLGLPISISPEVQAGATGPATLAGSLAQQTAEFLGHAVLAQIVHPGTPVVYGTVSSIFDMKKTMLAYGAPEADLLAIGTVQMARHYGVPARTTGGSSDANALGMQAGVESLMSTLLPMMAGSAYVLHGAGEMQNTLAVSYEKILIDEEIILMCRRIIDGIEVTPDTLAFDVIKEVGPRGHFLATDHTLTHFRGEQFMPSLMVRDRYESWRAGGEKRTEERARERAEKLLEQARPEPLPEHIARELEDIYRSFCDSLEVEG